jgi:hypothetical protein
VPKKTINAKEVLHDIKAGMHQNALMNKYGLSPGQLKRLTEKLEAAGLLEHPAPQPVREPSTPLYPLAFFTCPACGLSKEGEYEECPRCGVVLSKYESPVDSVGTQSSQDAAAKKVKFDGWSATTPKSYRLWKILVAIVVLAVGFTALVVIKRHREWLQLTKPVPVQHMVSPDEGVEDAGPTAPPRYKDMIDRRMPRVAPINPELDAHMRESLGDIGNALDDRTRAGEDLTGKP